MKRLLMGAMVIAGVVALIAVADLAAGIPFSRSSIMMDILFLLSALIVGYMGWESYRELR